MNTFTRRALAIGVLLASGHAMAQINFYEAEGYRGRVFAAQKAVPDFTRVGYNDAASSVVVDKGRWLVCENVRFQGRCVVLRPGSYESLRTMGFNNRVSSVRPAGNLRNTNYEMPDPTPAPANNWRRRANERTYEAPITSVRAVVGPPNQRCWVERQAAVEPAPQGNSVGGMVLGGLIGGILGHQVGGGSGKQIATVVGAGAGAYAGNQVGKNYGGNTAPVQPARDVQRCENVANPTPAYYDVTYNYRGTEHSVQMATPPAGRTIPVNARGEPRQ